MEIATELATELEKDLEKDENAREVELDRLETVYGLDRKSFETRLTALCRTPEAERHVRAAISREYRLRHPSLYTYEVLAHLLNHRYLDMIISFNFDELLDQSIEDELGRDEYTRVVTEGDFDPTRGVAGPLYVKMHGSATEPDSLRFTRERYYWTPRSIIELVEGKFNVDNLVLITIGFKMDSFDFQHLLRKPKGLEIYHLDPNELGRDVIAGVTEQRKKARERKETDRLPDTDKPSRVANFSVSGSQAGDKFLENVIGKLVKELEIFCKGPISGPAEWRSILRHEAVVKLIDDTDLSDEQHHERYLRRRTILEIAFTAAKGRGVVSIASMVSDRCGRYYDLYRQIAGDDADAWLSLCKAGGLVESHEYPDTYEVSPSVRRDSGTAGLGSYDIHKFHLADPQKLADHTAKSLGLSGNSGLIKLLTKALKYLQRETEIEIHYCDDRVCSKLFTKPTQLKTLTSLRGWTSELLLNTSEFDELWYVAETGDWILEPPIRDIVAERCDRMHLLQAFDAQVDIPGVEVETHQLPWGRHNRHMTILRNKNESRAAIYFVRRLRSPTVTPVYLADGAEDLRRVTVAFERLWLEAQSYEQERDRLDG